MSSVGESRSENAARQASPAALVLAGLLLIAGYLLSPPFVFAACHYLGVHYMPIGSIVYAPIIMIASRSPGLIAPLEAYCEVVLWLMGIPGP